MHSGQSTTTSREPSTFTKAPASYFQEDYKWSFLPQILHGAGHQVVHGSNLENHNWKPSEHGNHHTFVDVGRRLEFFTGKDNQNNLSREFVNYLRAAGGNAKADVKFAVPIYFPPTSDHVKSGHVTYLIIDAKNNNSEDFKNKLAKVQKAMAAVDEKHEGKATTTQLLNDKDFKAALKEVYPDTTALFLDTSKNPVIKKSPKQREALEKNVKDTFGVKVEYPQGWLQQKGSGDCGPISTEQVDYYLKNGKLPVDEPHVLEDETIKEIRKKHYEQAGLAFQLSQSFAMEASRVPRNLHGYEDSIEKIDIAENFIKNGVQSDIVDGDQQQFKLTHAGSDTTWLVTKVADGYVVSKAGQDDIALLVTKERITVANMKKLSPEAKQEAADQMAQVAKASGKKEVFLTAPDEESMACMRKACEKYGLGIKNDKPMEKPAIPDDRERVVPIPTGGEEGVRMRPVIFQG